LTFWPIRYAKARLIDSRISPSTPPALHSAGAWCAVAKWAPPANQLRRGGTCPFFRRRPVIVFDVDRHHLDIRMSRVPRRSRTHISRRPECESPALLLFPALASAALALVYRRIVWWRFHVRWEQFQLLCFTVFIKDLNRSQPPRRSLPIVSPTANPSGST
jgi:hypothetical protein